LDNARVHYRSQSRHPRDIITQLWKAKGYRSVRSLAIKAGISQPSLSRYLGGKSDAMEAASFQALANELGVTLSELLGEVPLESSGLLREAHQVFAQMTPEEQRQWIRLGHVLVQHDLPVLPAPDANGRPGAKPRSN
jgi:transcriptional regulator with XRE-family HTH domain